MSFFSIVIVNRLMSCGFVFCWTNEKIVISFQKDCLWSTTVKMFRKSSQVNEMPMTVFRSSLKIFYEIRYTLSSQRGQMSVCFSYGVRRLAKINYKTFCDSSRYEKISENVNSAHCRFNRNSRSFGEMSTIAVIVTHFVHFAKLWHP